MPILKPSLESNDIETVAPARVGDTLGYTRVSTHDQNPDAQSERLIEAGAIRVFTDIVSGKRFDRPALAELIDHARPGDRLCIIRLDRLGRSLRELLETVDGLKACGIHLDQPRGAPRHLVRGRRTRVPRLRLHRPLRTPAHLRAYPRRHRRRQETRANTGSTTARPGRRFPPLKKLIEAGLSPARAAKQLGIGRATAYRIAKALR